MFPNKILVLMHGCGGVMCMDSSEELTAYQIKEDDVAKACTRVIAGVVTTPRSWESTIEESRRGWRANRPKVFLPSAE